MTTDRKHPRLRLPARPEDVFIAMGGPVQDPVEAWASNEIDAADDRRWLAEHPQADERHRMATTREMAAYGLPPGCSVVVQRGPMGSQFRLIYPPAK